MPDNDLRWSEGLRGTPRDYIRIGRLLELAEANGPDGLDLTGLNATEDELSDLLDVIGEADAEDQAAWDSGDYEAELAALEAEAAALLGREPRDLSSGYGYGETDLTALEFSEAAGLAQDRRDQAMSRTRMARMIGLDGWQRRGDMAGMMEAYLEAGTAGHRVELANAAGPDVSRQIELARATTGRYASICGAADAFGRCAAQFHAAECSHVAEAAASYGAAPEDAQAWRGALQRHAALSFADADGEGWRNGSGNLATAADHVEARTGQRTRREGIFEPGRARPGLASIQRQGPRFRDPSADPGADPGAEIPYGTSSAARALAAQAHLGGSADAARHREAQRAAVAQAKALRAVTTSGRRHPDLGESMRERADRLHQPVQLSNVMQPDDGLLGALPSFTYGQL